MGVLSAECSRRVRTASLLVTLLFAPSVAHADGPFEGTWREGPMNIRVDVQAWGGDCGQRPQSTTAPGGGTFRISQEGDQLTFHLRQQRTTRSCWSENRAVRRVSSTYQSSTWRIVCRTPPDDSRAETGTYTIQAIGEDQLSFRDVSTYDWQLNESRCRATITTTQTFTRASPRAPVATPTPTPTPTEPRPSCTPGAAARVQLRPSTAELAPNGEQCFTTRVVDARGCALRNARVQLALAAGSPGRLEGRCYHAPAGDARATLVAQAGELRDEASVVVRSMDMSDLIARRTETGSLGGGDLQADEEASSDTAARVSTRPAEPRMSLLGPAVAVIAALVLVIGAAIVLARRRRAKPGRHAKVPVAYGATITPAPSGASTKTADEPSEDMICPTCRRGHPPGAVRCAHDGATLVPYREFAAAKGDEKVCPTCGERYPGHVTFCGKDGATLEPAG